MSQKLTGQEIVERVASGRCIDCNALVIPFATASAKDCDPTTGFTPHRCKFCQGKFEAAKVKDESKATAATRKQHKQDGIDNLDRLLKPEATA